MVTVIADASTMATTPTYRGVFDREEFIDFPHERVLFCRDQGSGLRAIIAVHSFALGPAIGGCRMYPYADEESALVDVLRLSRGMTFKAAIAGLRNGGAKAVIIGDPATDKTPALFEAFGRFVDDLGGKYVTAGDVGTDSDDMDLIGRTTDFVAFRSEAAGGSGDSGANTARGVLQALRAGAQAQWGSTSLSGRTVGVEGLGKVGLRLAEMLVAADATVVVSDSDPAALKRIRSVVGEVDIVDDVRSARTDVYAPCALGGTITHDVAATTTARVICGAANNQLAAPEVADLLDQRGIVWVPDYVANAGGLIQAAAEVAGDSADTARRKVDVIFDSALETIEYSRRERISTGTAADRLALDRIDGARSH